jgi:hypothetical protein
MSVCGKSLGFTIGPLFKEANQAAAMGPLITLPSWLFQDFTIN